MDWKDIFMVCSNFRNLLIFNKLHSAPDQYYSQIKVFTFHYNNFDIVTLTHSKVIKLKTGTLIWVLATVDDNFASSWKVSKISSCFTRRWGFFRQVLSALKFQYLLESALLSLKFARLLSFIRYLRLCNPDRQNKTYIHF